MLDTLLVIPPYYYKTKVLTSSVKEYAGVAYLAAVLRQEGFTVEILDADLAGYSVEQTFEQVMARPARLVGFTVLQVAASLTLDLIKRLRQSGITSHICVGGHFPSFATEEIFLQCPRLDSIAIGEAEKTIVELMHALASGQDWHTVKGLAYRDKSGAVEHTPVRPLIGDLDALPFQSRDTLPEVIRRGGPAAVISSRGCYGDCGFCSVNAFYGKSPGPKWRGRSPENLVAEIQMLCNRYGAKIFVFNDDNFLGPGKKGKLRARRIGEEILKRGLDIQFAIPAAVNDVEAELFGFLKTAGLRSVFLGIESMNQGDLKYLNKHTTVEQNEKAIETLERLGIFYQIGFILFYPDSTLEQIEYNIRYLRDRVVNNEYCGTQVFTGELKILHGTKIEQKIGLAPYVRKDRFHYTYESHDKRVDRLRYLMDHLILKKTFPLMIDCKEEFMGASLKRYVRVAICDLQLSMALKVIHHLKKGEDISPDRMKPIIRVMNREIRAIREKVDAAVAASGEDEIEYAEKYA